MTRCPKCESSETLNVKFVGHSGIVAYPEVQRNKLFPKCSGIHARACAKCGHIFDFTLDKPENFTPFVTLD
ncbi:MAG: DUF2652 domain-containing protein [Clostridia bacterium]|nr:DUF2652 domain-containing protein [Clostridia bacterium]